MTDGRYKILNITVKDKYSDINKIFRSQIVYQNVIEQFVLVSEHLMNYFKGAWLSKITNQIHLNAKNRQ